MKLSFFNELSFIDALKEFFKELDVPINYLGDLPDRPKQILQDNYRETEAFHLMEDVYLLGMVDDAAFKGEVSSQIKEIHEDYDGILIFGVTLNQRKNGLNPTRSQLAEISRAFNREFKYTPVIVIFKYGNFISFANTERLKYKQEFREGEKAGKVSLLKDIEIEHPHRGHLSILEQLKIPRTGKGQINSFSGLYYYWQSIFSISVLNKIFYQEIISWFNNAIEEIKIPSEMEGSEKHKDFTVRLIARLIFIWFLKELKVVKEELLLPQFRNGELNEFIKPINDGTDYYKFILQNLFFNALNREQAERDENLFDVYSSNFENPADIKRQIFFSPFLNGGLFDIHKNDWCLENEVNNAFIIPDKLFLDEETGLNSILSRYKFTIAENTPTEEEIAVDPEMLGRIFENLLAEQSDDTKEVARNNAGAFYTPRPVVSYMCRKTLLQHLNIKIEIKNGKQIIHKLLNTSIIDIACGSGAFPMGMLEEMMQVLETVDPDGNLWVSEMLKSTDRDFLEHISDFIADKQIRYVKKLGLLRNCLFGIDILEYAVEITKLRCWLSLIVEQRVDFEKPNYNLKPLPNLEFKFYKKNSLFRQYKGENLNDLVTTLDNEKLLDELLNLENEYFITKSSKHGTKEEIKEKIIALLEKVVDSQTEKIQKEYNSANRRVSSLVSTNGTEREIKSAENKLKKYADELDELSIFRTTIKDYFIEKVVFPSLFSSQNPNRGFDIVIGNPPYVNTKLISSMGLTKKLEEEYGYCDDLYNHFTIRGLELVKKGGLLTYITSDTFLVLSSKENMRRIFIGIPSIIESGDGLFSTKEELLPEGRLIELVNTPKAFAAMVDTAIFCLRKEFGDDNSDITYVDLRFPDAETFRISVNEWERIKQSNENISGWEKVLSNVFSELSQDIQNNVDWFNNHSCNSIPVYLDGGSTLRKYRTKLFLYQKSLNFSIFPPSKYICQLFDKIIKPYSPILHEWWNKIEDSQKVEKNLNSIKSLVINSSVDDMLPLGTLVEGGVGLQTGDNGKFVGVLKQSPVSAKIIQSRVDKLYKLLLKEPDAIELFESLDSNYTRQDIAEYLNSLDEKLLRNKFDSVKEIFGRRAFGKGYIYRLIDDNELVDIDYLSKEEKTNGIDTLNEVYVRYDKGDREGNKWLSNTPYLINWNKASVYEYATSSIARNFSNNKYYFKSGFSWNIVNGTRNTNNHKFKFIEPSVNDVGGMKLTLHEFASHKISNKYIVCICNSLINNRLTEAFINFTVNFQMNDARQIPIKIPSGELLSKFEEKFDKCYTIQQRLFSGEIDKSDAKSQLRKHETEIDKMVDKLYEISVKAEVFEEDEELAKNTDFVDDNGQGEN